MSLAPAILTREADAFPQQTLGTRASPGQGQIMQLKNLQTFRPTTNPVQIFDYKISPDGRRIAVHAPQEILSIYEFPPMKLISQAHRIHESSRDTFAFLADSRRILSTPHVQKGERGRSRVAASVYDSDDGKRLFDIPKPEAWFDAPQIGSFLATACDGSWPVLVSEGSEVQFGLIDIELQSIVRTFRSRERLSFYRSHVFAIASSGVLATAPTTRIFIVQRLLRYLI